MRGGDQGGCEPRIEVIVKVKKEKLGEGGVWSWGGSGWWGGVGRGLEGVGGWVGGKGVGGFGDVNQEHKGIVQY